MESKFIAAILSDRGAYEEVKDTLETADFSDLGTLIINQAIDFYKADPAARHVDNDVLLSRISRVHPAQEKLVANFLANMEPVSIPNMLQEYVDIRLASLARHLSQRMATGKVDPETRELIAQYQFLEERREAGLRDEEDNEVSIGLSVDSVLEALAPEQLVPIFPRQLNDAIGGGAPPGTHIVVFARPESLSRDTEVLTPSGWLPVDQVTMDTVIAQVDKDRNVSFTNPTGVFTHEQEECYHIHDTLGRVDLIVTKGHAMVVEKKGELIKERAEDVIYYQGVKHHTSGYVAGNTTLSFYERFLIAYQADGMSRIRKNKDGTFYGRIVVQKDRKIERLTWILNNINCEYCVYTNNRGQLEFSVWSPVEIHKDFSWVDMSKVTTLWGREFLEEVKHWDGSIRTDTRFKYDTTDKSCADTVQAIGALSGYNVFHSVHSDERKDSFRDIHALTLRSNYQPVDGQCVKKDLIPFTDTTYCFTVPTGMLLVRRNGATAITGNTGKTMFCVNMLCGFLTNGRKALYIGNEDPASNIKMRIINNITGMPKAEVESDRVRADRIVEEVVEDRLIYADLHPGSPGDVRSLVAKHRPDVVLVDQIRNLRTPRSFTKVEGLEYIAKEMRNIGKEFGCVMVSVTQAGDSADGKIELGMGDIDFSNTGIPATADVLIGIGCTPQMEMFGKRKLSLPKNKLSGNHNSIDVDVNPSLSEVK